MFWPKKKTQEQKMQHRIDRVLLTLTDSSDFVFTELETVQILNNVRRKLNENLTSKRQECQTKSLEFQQKGKEIQNALNFLE